MIRFLHRLEKVDCQSGEKMRSLEGSPFTFLQTQKREINPSILSFYIFIVHKHLYANAFPDLTTLRIIHIFHLQQSNGSNINLLYSTPSCYLFNVNHLNQVWNSTKDDFFPYASRENTFWSGYFSSRAALKGYARKSNNFLQVQYLVHFVKISKSKYIFKSFV